MTVYWMFVLLWVSWWSISAINDVSDAIYDVAAELRRFRIMFQEPFVQLNTDEEDTNDPSTT